MEIIGFVTQDDTSRLPESFQKPDSQLVYIPMSYMIGGFTLLIPRKNLTPLQHGHGRGDAFRADRRDYRQEKA